MIDVPTESTFIEKDPYLQPFSETIQKRTDHVSYVENKLTGSKITISQFASAHEYYGLHKEKGSWVFREWAPNATSIKLFGDFTNWEHREYFALTRLNENGDWEIRLPEDTIHHYDLYKLHITWHGGCGDRIPAYARRVVQDTLTKIFTAQVWNPADTYQWQHSSPDTSTRIPLIYESHVGMAQEDGRVGCYHEFRENVLPRIHAAGYNIIQFMAIQEHPYYGSFGYHVSNFFAASSRFGTPEELKELIDAAHKLNIAVIVDLIHSHSVSNELEGLSRFDGSLYQYFHEGARGKHVAWNSRCFDYGKPQVLHFLLSNCKFWLEEYKIDGFRFDGVTSMMYHHRGLGADFGSYDAYFSRGDVDNDAIAYLTLANKLIHEINPGAITIAEDVSGMPGLCAPISESGCGFDYRLAMGMPDTWFKLVRKQRDQDWNMNQIWHTITDHRPEEKTISYVESHDQAIVGDKTMIFELLGAAMYDNMSTQTENLIIDRGIALHKLIRLATASANTGGYLNFMGNEFGHPEWIDFPREENDWSYHYARRQWSLRDNQDLRYHYLADFDEAMLKIITTECDAKNNYPNFIFAHDGDNVLAFERNNTYFFFNFHPETSFTDYGISVPEGTYELIMDSDEERFGGGNRLTPHQQYTTQQIQNRHMLKLYLPNRTALILKRLDK